MSSKAIAVWVALLYFLICLAVLAVTLILFLKLNNEFFSGQKIKDCSLRENSIKTSNSKGWQTAAKIFAQSVDLSINPCESKTKVETIFYGNFQDFYQFSCGNWLRSHSSADSTATFNILQAEVVEKITDILNKTVINAKNASEPLSARDKVKVFWSYCSQFNETSYNGSSYLLNLIETYGGWPIINSQWSKMKYSLGYLMGRWSTLYGVNTFITQTIETNWANPATGYMLFLDQASLTLPLIYYTTPAVWETSKPKLISYIASGIKINESKILEDAADIANMEHIIASMAVPVANQRNATKQYNLYTYKTLTEMSAWSSVNWFDYFDQLGQNGALNSTQLMRLTLGIKEVSYMIGFTEWLTKANGRLRQNYMIWRLIEPKLQFLPGAYREAFDDYQRSTIDKNTSSSKEEQCTKTVLKYLGFALSRMYIDNYWNKLPESPRSSLSAMIESVKTAFGRRIEDLHWMDEETKLSAKAKIASLVKNVGYPDWIMNDAQLNDYYEVFVIQQKTNFIEILENATRFLVYKSFSKLLKPQVNRKDFNSPPATVNAWYQPELNSITFPAAILNPPFFSSDFPSSVNYGAIGVVMGHELTHGFDDQGVQWNGTGFLNPWIDAKSITGFQNMAQCVINEYNGFCYNSSLNLNPNCISGQRTQGEDIADSGGIKAAWNAYQSLNQNFGIEPRLPGLMSLFTHDQLFFMSFAQVWCGNMKQSGIENQLLTDPHSPAKYRVLGTIQNVPDLFIKAFNCPINSPMTPRKHCTVW